MPEVLSMARALGEDRESECHTQRVQLSCESVQYAGMQELSSSHKTGCLMEEVGVPRTSTHWMGLKSTPL